MASAADALLFGTGTLPEKGLLPMSTTIKLRDSARRQWVCDRCGHTMDQEAELVTGTDQSIGGVLVCARCHGRHRSPE